MQEPAWDFEGQPPFEEMSETGINLCAYFDAMSDAQLQTYRPSLSDQELMAWDGNFTSEDTLLLPCCESEDVDVQMYRRFIEQCIRYRNSVRHRLSSAA